MAALDCTGRNPPRRRPSGIPNSNLRNPSTEPEPIRNLSGQTPKAVSCPGKAEQSKCLTGGGVWPSEVSPGLHSEQQCPAPGPAREPTVMGPKGPVSTTRITGLQSCACTTSINQTCADGICTCVYCPYLMCMSVQRLKTESDTKPAWDSESQSARVQRASEECASVRLDCARGGVQPVSGQ